MGLDDGGDVGGEHGEDVIAPFAVLDEGGADWAFRDDGGAADEADQVADGTTCDFGLVGGDPVDDGDGPREFSEKRAFEFEVGGLGSMFGCAEAEFEALDAKVFYGDPSSEAKEPFAAEGGQDFGGDPFAEDAGGGFVGPEYEGVEAGLVDDMRLLSPAH